MEAKKGAGKKGSGKADWALNHIQKLYRIETQLKDKTVEERHLARQEKKSAAAQSASHMANKISATSATENQIR